MSENEIGQDAIDLLKKAREQIFAELSKVIVGQQDVIEQILISIFSRGHCLLEGVPGLAKTLMISTLSDALDLSFSRIQFTPDLMPADITGTEIIEENKSTGARERRFMEGPIFSNIILADEINRTPPKTQAALLEAMQERTVTVGRVRHQLSNPFFVLATQNPIEQEGTYPLPEAQQDRFMFKIFVDYPNFQDEFEVARRTTARSSYEVKPVLSGDDIIKLQETIRDVPVSDHVIRYALLLVRQTRVGSQDVPGFISESVGWGAGPRAVQNLILGGKTRALLYGRTHVSTDDIQAIAKPVLRHRLAINFAAQSDGISADDVIQQLIDETPTKEDELTNDARFQKILHPEAIKRIARLDLRAQHIVEGFLSGMHRSPYFGQSVEFLQHREYTPGDDLRHVDWQVWARQDRLYVKQFEEDTNMRVNLLVDVSKSMEYGEGHLNKYEYASTIAVSLAYLVLKHQDAVGCMTFDAKVRSKLQTRSKGNQLMSIIQSLDNNKPADKTNLADIFMEAAETYPRRGMMIVISDFFGDVESTLRGLRVLRQRGHDVLLFHVLDDDELEFPFSGPTRFEDMESDMRLNCNPKALRDGYLEALQVFLDEMRRGAAKSAIDYMLVRTSDPLDAILATYLSRRMARARGK